MDFGADMMGDEANDTLAVGRREQFTRVGKPSGKPVDPEPPIGVEHHLDDRGVFQKPGDRRPEGRAQHARTAKDRLRFLVSRSEEHTSELQSLMRISYAVFCLKKKKNHLSIRYANTNTSHCYYQTQHNNHRHYKLPNQ